MVNDGKAGSDEAKKTPPDFLAVLTTKNSNHDVGQVHDDSQPSDFDPMMAFGDEAGALFDASAKTGTITPAGQVQEGDQSKSGEAKGDGAKGDDTVTADGEPKETKPAPKDAPALPPAASKVDQVDFKEAPGEKPVPETTDADTRKKVEEFDSKFRERLQGLEKTIDAASKEKKAANESLYGVQVQTINVMESIGKEHAGREGTSKEAGSKEKELDLFSKHLEIQNREKMEAVPTRQRDHLVLKSTFLIASGKDENIQAGEKQLAELIRDHPELGVDENFQETVLRAYSEMNAMRTARGLGEWQSKLKVDDILPALPDSNKSDQSSIELLQAASKTFFADGITKALPEFEKAKARAELDVNTVDRTRISLFLDSLGMNQKILLASASGKDVAELAEQRSQQIDKELQAFKQSRESRDLRAAIDSNCAFAKLAGGDAEQFKAGKKDLAAILEKNPNLALNPEFVENARNAFKAHFSTTDAVAAKPGDSKPGTADGAPVFGPAQLEPKYDGLDLEKRYKRRSEDHEVQAYAVDTATTIGLYGVTIGMGVVSFIRTRNAIRNARALKAEVEAAHTVKPLGSGAEQPSMRRGAEDFSVKGQATDGRIVLKKEPPKSADVKPSDAKPAETKPFAEITPDKDFNPKKAKFGSFTPVSHDGKRYYADKDGTVFEHTDGKLKETAVTRELRLISAEEYKAQGGVIDTPATDKPAVPADGKPVTDKPVVSDPAKPAEGRTISGADPAKALLDRIAENPTIKAGLDVLVKQGKTELASQILDLKAAGKLPTRVESYLNPAGATRLSDPSRVDLLNQLVSDTRTTLGLAPSAPKVVPAGEVLPKEVTAKVEGPPVTERHNGLIGSGDTSAAKVRPAELMVTVSHTGSDGVTTSKRVSLLELSPEQLGDRLHALTPEKLATDIKATEEKIKVAEAEKRSADLEKLTERLADLNALKTMKGEHELAKKSGNQHEFLAKKQAEARAGFGGRALKGLGTAGVVSALLLLFNDLVPDVRFGNDSGDRVLPGSKS